MKNLSAKQAASKLEYFLFPEGDFYDGYVSSLNGGLQVVVLHPSKKEIPKQYEGYPVEVKSLH